MVRRLLRRLILWAMAGAPIAAQTGAGSASAQLYCEWLEGPAEQTPQP